MTVEIPAGFYQVLFNFITPAPGGYHESVCTFGSGPDPDASMLGLANSWRNAFWTNQIGGDTADNVILRQIIVQDATNAVVLPVLDAGARTGATSPPNVATLVSKNSGLRGRANQGRCYWPGLLTDSEVLDNGTLDSGRLADLQAAFEAAFQELVDDSTVQPFILHSEGSALDPTPILSLQVSNVISTQRRRLR